MKEQGWLLRELPTKQLEMPTGVALREVPAADARVYYLKAGRTTLPRAYLACLGLTVCMDFNGKAFLARCSVPYIAKKDSTLHKKGACLQLIEQDFKTKPFFED